MKLHTHLGNKFIFIALVTLSFLNVACTSNDEKVVPAITTTDSDGATTIDEDALNETLDTLPIDALDASEVAGILFMREEEKLARDAYLYLYSIWNSNVFNNIANSEQTHTDAMLTLLDRYAITDPVGTNAEGVFVDSYLQDLYDALTASGSASFLDGLYVGAEIEEIDLIDIQALVDTLDGNEDIALVYENLMKGSRNHLRAFVNNISAEGVDYAPRHLSQEVYDAIINSSIEN